jgi:iron complex transport system permease protein
MKKSFGLFILIFALALAGVVSVFFGPSGLPSVEILVNFRLPRVVMAAVVGAGLAVSGVLMQGTLRNPLADPYIIGTSAGAAFGVILCSVFAIKYSSIFFYIVVVSGAFCSTMAVYFIARVKNRTPLVNLVLSGMIVNTFIVAIILTFFILYRQHFFGTFVFMMGNISEGDTTLILVSFVLVVLGVIVSLLNARRLDILTMGEEKALHLGLDAERIKVINLFASALMTSGAVSIAGTVGFVGFIVPHILRLIFGPLHKNLIIASVFGGALFLIICDTVARTIIAPREIPVGILTVLSGAPFFLWLLRRKKGDYIF